MDRNYTYRRSGGPVRRPSRHKRPPWILWILIATILVGLVVFLITRFFRENSTENPNENQNFSSQLYTPNTQTESIEPVSNNPIETPIPQTDIASLPQQRNPDSIPEDNGSLMVVDGIGYEYYNFSEQTTNEYITTIARARDSLPSTVTIYNIVVPTSIDIMLSGNYLDQNQVNSSDQKKAIDNYILPSINAISPDVRTVPVFDALRRHCNENIYFNTDRTWTQLGAYYAYVEFCKAKGISAIDLEQFEQKEYEGFLGGFYSITEDLNMASSSDTVNAYISSANTSLTFTDNDGNINENWPIISDGSSYNSSWLYLIFAAGDQPYKVLQNSDLNDGSACVVVQESFGNFFIPFLSSHYQYVYVVDYTLYDGNLVDLVSEHSASDVIIINNIIATSTSSAVEDIKKLF